MQMCSRDIPMPSVCFVLKVDRAFFRAVMAMVSLRTFVSEAHARVLVPALLDREVVDPLMEERLTRIRAQIIASLALHEQLTEMGFEIDASIDLYSLVRFAQKRSILHLRQVGVLLQINMEANQAKHELHFASRL